MKSKTIVFSILVLSVFILFCGCGDTEADQAKEKKITSTPEVTQPPEDIKVKALNGDIELPPYLGLTYQGAVIEVTETEVAEQMELLLDYYSVFTEVKDRETIEEGDVVRLTYSYCDSEGNELLSGKDYYLDLTKKTFGEESVTTLVGRKIGTKVRMEITYKPDFEIKEVAGKTVELQMTPQKLYRKDTPELSDELIAAHFDAYDTVDEYKKAIIERLTTEKKTEERTRGEEEILGKLVAQTSFVKDYTEEITTYYDGLMSYYEKQAAVEGMTFDKMIEVWFDTDKEGFLRDLSNSAERYIKSKYCLMGVAELEKLSITDAEYSDQITDYMAEYGYQEQETFEADYGSDVIRENMLYDKALEFLWNHAVKE